MKTIKIKMLRTTFVSGDLAKKGDIIDASEKNASFLIARGKAEIAPAKVEKKAAKKVEK